MSVHLSRLLVKSNWRLAPKVWGSLSAHQQRFAKLTTCRNLMYCNSQISYHFKIATKYQVQRCTKYRRLAGQTWPSIESIMSMMSKSMCRASSWIFAVNPQTFWSCTAACRILWLPKSLCVRGLSYTKWIRPHSSKNLLITHWHGHAYTYVIEWFHMVSHGFTSFHIVSHGFTWFHMVSHGFTWFHIVHISKTLPRRAIQASACRWSRKRTTHAPKESTEQFWKMKTTVGRLGTKSAGKKLNTWLPRIGHADCPASQQSKWWQTVLEHALSPSARTSKDMFAKCLPSGYSCIWNLYFLISCDILVMLWYLCLVRCTSWKSIRRLPGLWLPSSDQSRIHSTLSPKASRSCTCKRTSYAVDILSTSLDVTGRHWTSLALAHDVTVDVRSSSVCGHFPSSPRHQVPASLPGNQKVTNIYTMQRQ